MDSKLITPYQQKAIETILPLIGKQPRIALRMPTGTGRLFTISHILFQYLHFSKNLYEHKILFIVDRVSILNNAIFTLEDIFKQTNIITNNIKNIESPIFITTIQSLVQNDKYLNFSKNNFDLIVFYECIKSNKSIKSRLTEIFSYFIPKTYINVESSEGNTSSFFGKPAYQYTTRQAIEDGYLVPYKIKQVTFFQDSLDLSDEQRTHKSFLITQQTMDRLVSSIIEMVQNEKSVIFCSDQKTAINLSETINSRSTIHSEAIVGSLSDISRNKIIEEFKLNDQTVILTTVDILISGISLPNVKNIIILRNYYYSIQLLELISNFLKPYSGKKYLQIIDYVGTTNMLKESLEEPIPLVEHAGDKNKLFSSLKFSKTDILFRDKNSLNGVIGVKDIAEELAELVINMPCEQGRMIGIFGKWGRGKTFLMNETWEYLKNDNKLIRIDFQAWKYQDTPGIWAYLYEQFVNTFYNQPIQENYKLLEILKLKSIYHHIKRICRKFFLNIERKGVWPFLWLVVLGIFAIYGIYYSTSEKLIIQYKILTWLGIPGVIYFFSLYSKHKNSVKELFDKYCTKFSLTHILGIQEEIQKELKTLFKVWGRFQKKFKILLFVDDIDRCSEEKIIQIIDSLRIMLDDTKLSTQLVIVTAIDERILKRAIKLKYHRLLNDENKNLTSNMKKLVSEYLDKLFIIGLKLSDLTPDEKDEFFLELTKSDREDQEMIPFSKLQTSPSIEKETVKEKHNIPKEATEQERINDSFSEEINDEESFNEESFNEEINDDIQEANYFIRKNKNRQPISATKLTVQEINLLREKIQLYEEITPRQIRIFYYRYLVAKNLLIRIYTKIKRENIWISEPYASAFIELLVLLNKHEDPEMISKLKMKILKSNGQTFKIPMLKDVEVECIDCRLLINILDTVIGY